MLAIKIILADVDRIPTMIFDEIDNGIGGAVSIGVGEKLAALSASHQVLCITHIAQIASRAHRNFLIEKKVAGGKTATHVAVLRDEALRREIARLISGDSSSKTSLDLAGEMIGERKVDKDSK
jgi:DNA repair protein RecN (Recombination protein N)